VEFFPNRPDYFSVEGVARTLKGFMGIEKGMPHYDLSSSKFKITVDPNLKSIRPYTACCVVEGIRMNEEKLKQLMEFQEDLHWVMGRDRKKVAIGIHNLDVLTPPFSYRAADPDTVSFVPLETEEEMSLRQILQRHKKGRKYAHLIEKFDKYPLILDSKDNVLSMPPIINGELTKLSKDTQNVLVDVTGTDEKAVNHTLNIIASSFAEGGARIKTMEMVYEEKTVLGPDFTPKEKLVRVENARKTIGVDLTAEDAVRMLQIVRMDAEAVNDKEIKVQVPPYRIDILHEVDLIENIAIGYCFRKIGSKLPAVATVASEDRSKIFENQLREIMVGMSFYEVMSLMLTNEDCHYKNMRLPEDERVMVAQPISQERTMIRKSLLNGLLEFLEDNKHEELPQKIFEVGDVVYLEKGAETCTKLVKKLAGAVTHSHANFTEIKSITDAVLCNISLRMELEPSDHLSFIKGRCAALKGIYIEKSADRNGEMDYKNREGQAPLVSVKGFFGEVHPEVITNFDLEYPVIAFELEFQDL
jgi:phenylalanyl-tRNA synthetase beta chain